MWNHWKFRPAFKVQSMVVIINSQFVQYNIKTGNDYIMAIDLGLIVTVLYHEIYKIMVVKRNLFQKTPSILAVILVVMVDLVAVMVLSTTFILHVNFLITSVQSRSII